MPGCFAICMSVRLSGCLSVCLVVCMSDCRFVWLSVRCKSATQISFQFQFGFGKNISFEQVVDFHSCHPPATPTATLTYTRYPHLPPSYHSSIIYSVPHPERVASSFDVYATETIQVAKVQKLRHILTTESCVELLSAKSHSV